MAELVEKDRRIAELEAQLARTKDGSLFNIRADTIDDPADAGVRNARAHRASMGKAPIKRAAKKSQAG